MSFRLHRRSIRFIFEASEIILEASELISASSWQARFHARASDFPLLRNAIIIYDLTMRHEHKIKS